MKIKTGNLILLVCMISVLCLTGCRQRENSCYKPFEDDGKIHVVTSIYAAYDFARQVGGENADVRLLLKPGSEAHSFEPTPRDVIAIEKCDVFICTGGENDVWVETILEGTNLEDFRIIRMTDCVGELLEEEEVDGMQGEGGLLSGILGEEHHHHHHEHDHEDDEHDHEDDEHDHEDDEHDHEEEAEWDEHVWMDIDNAVKICENIAEMFAEQDERHADYYRKNCNKYADTLYKIDDEIRQTIEAASRKEVIFADRFPARYFVERYGLTYSAAFPGCSESTEASAATVSHLINIVRKDSIPVVFKMELSSGKLAKVVSGETGASIGTFYTGHNVTAQDYENGMTFADMMESNAKLLADALN